MAFFLLFIQDRSQSFLQSPDISGAVGENRERFNQILFATAPPKCKISQQKLNRACYCVLPYSNWDIENFRLKSISIGRYTVRSSTRALRYGDPSFLGEVTTLRGAVR